MGAGVTGAGTRRWHGRPLPACRTAEGAKPRLGRESKHARDRERKVGGLPGRPVRVRGGPWRGVVGAGEAGHPPAMPGHLTYSAPALCWHAPIAIHLVSTERPQPFRDSLTTYTVLRVLRVPPRLALWCAWEARHLAEQGPHPHALSASPHAHAPAHGWPHPPPPCAATPSSRAAPGALGHLCTQSLGE